MDKRLTSISTGLPWGMTVALKKFDSSIFQFLFGQNALINTIETAPFRQAGKQSILGIIY